VIVGPAFCHLLRLKLPTACHHSSHLFVNRGALLIDQEPGRRQNESPDRRLHGTIEECRTYHLVSQAQSRKHVFFRRDISGRVSGSPQSLPTGRIQPLIQLGSDIPDGLSGVSMMVQSFHPRTEEIWGSSPNERRNASLKPNPPFYTLISTDLTN